MSAAPPPPGPTAEPAQAEWLTLPAGESQFTAVHPDRQRDHTYVSRPLLVRGAAGNEAGERTLDPRLKISDLRHACQSGKFLKLYKEKVNARVRAPHEMLPAGGDDAPFTELSFEEADFLARLVGCRLPTVHEVHRVWAAGALRGSKSEPDVIWTCSPWWPFRLTFCMAVVADTSAADSAVTWHRPEAWNSPKGEPADLPGLARGEATLVDLSSGFDQVRGGEPSLSEWRAGVWMVRDDYG